jgi:CheY-like chemotaxis protein
MSNRLLLADGDPKSLRVLEVSLRNAGFQVSTAESGPAAWDAIQRENPAVIIADPDLPELDGLALCARVRERAPDRSVPFIFIGADRSVEARVRGLQAGADDYLLKPTYVNEVISRVRALVQRRERDKLTSSDAPPDAFQGQLRDITVVDLLEVVAANRRSGIIHLRGPRGATGAVYFRQGAVIDAEVGRLSGADAIERLFSWTEGSFEIEWKNIRRPDAIARATSDLVLEGMKRLDQKARAAADNPARDGVYEVNYQVLADRLAEIPDEVNSILRLFNGARPLAQVIEDAQVPDADALTLIARLRDEGIIVEVKPKAPDPTREAVPRPISRDGDSARNGAAGAERPAGRAGAASGPVGQSFADRMRSGGAGPAAAEPSGPRLTVAPRHSDTPPPPPPPTTTKTDRGFPQLDVLPSPSIAERSDLPVGASRGEANLELLNGGDEVEPDVSPGRASDDNVIPFPSEGRPSSQRAVVEAAADEAAPPPSEDEMSPEELAALFGSTSIEAAPSNQPASESGSSSGESAAPKVPVSMLQTQRGFGLPPPPPPPQSGQSGQSGHDGGELESPPTEVAPARSSSPLEAVAPPVEPDATETPADAGRSAAPAPPPAVRTITGGGGVVAASTVAEATAQYNDRDLSKNEALDELGVPGRTRALRILAVALVLGAAGAVAAYRFRPHGSGDATAITDKPTLVAPARPPQATESQRTGQEPPPVPAATHESASAGDRGELEAKNPSAKSDGEKGAATVAEKTTTKATGNASAEVPERAAEKGPKKARLEERAKPAKIAEPNVVEKTAEKTPNEAKRSAEVEKASGPDAFRQQLAECRALFAKNRFREAGTVCGAAVQSNPRSADALTMLAHVELNRGHMSRAYDLAQKAISIYPDQPDAYVIIGGVHQDGGRTEQAKAAYQRYLHLAPHGRYAVELRSIVGSL